MKAEYCTLVQCNFEYAEKYWCVLKAGNVLH